MRCGKWWFSGDTLHEFKPAQEAKFNYYRLWGVTTNVTEVFLPLLVLAVMGIGLTAGVKLLQNRQQVGVPAAENIQISNLEVVYVGGGEATVSFYGAEGIYQVGFRAVGEPDWRTEPVERSGGLYRAQLRNLVEGQAYELTAAGRILKFVAR